MERAGRERGGSGQGTSFLSSFSVFHAHSLSPPHPLSRPLLSHRQAAALRKSGVDSVICVAHGDPVEVFSWAASAGADGSAGVSALADRDGSFARMLGVEAPPGAPYATHRYAALVEDGILLKLKVDDTPGECVKTRGEELLDCARSFFVH
jgi:hypothetical protein